LRRSVLWRPILACWSSLLFWHLQKPQLQYKLHRL
jgi:hypothetical protein